MNQILICYEFILFGQQWAEHAKHMTFVFIFCSWYSMHKFIASVDKRYFERGETEMRSQICERIE